MAIHFEPDDSPPASPSSDLGMKVTGQDYGTGEDHYRTWPRNRDWSTFKDVETPKQRGPRVEVTSRAELIESIKRGERPTWVPNPGLEALLATYHNSSHGDHRPRVSKARTSPPVPPLDQEKRSEDGSNSPTRDLEPAEIERPPSALHTGDFFEKRPSSQTPRSATSIEPCSSSPPKKIRSSSPSTPWYAPDLPSGPYHPIEPGGQQRTRPKNVRSRAPSLGSSLSSSFVFRPPTSPLVHAASNTDLDFSAGSNVKLPSSSPERGNRRRTLPPNCFQSFRFSPSGNGAATNFSRPFVPVRRESSLPYQAHQPRRSLTSILTSQSLSNPQTPSLPRSRRPSLSSDSSPIQHASMVGSFEESILRGRMSTAPSKPLDFVAQIGVLGRGECKSKLRCPPHVTVPFPAVFYSYPSIGARSFSDDSPSPYVGTIDLEHSLKPLEMKKVRRRPSSPSQRVDPRAKEITAPDTNPAGLAIDRLKKRERQRKRSASPRGPLGGCYRVPQQGQLQIVIKNPNKTAVKLYLVPYSLDGMEPGTKTFVRQRSFSAGPILEKPLTVNPESVLTDPLQHKAILRYLIHLKFCCPSKGRYYLYDNIRVVFANRVPDGNENLRNEVQLPEPRYSSYRPGREGSMGSARAKLAAEKSSRRRRSGSGQSLTSADAEAMDGLIFTEPATNPHARASGTAPPTAIPFHLSPRLKAAIQCPFSGAGAERLATDTAFGVYADIPAPSTANGAPAVGLDDREAHESATSPTPGFVPSTSTRASPVQWETFGFNSNSPGSTPLSRTVSPSSTECSEGLLSRELRSREGQQNGHSSLSS